MSDTNSEETEHEKELNAVYDMIEKAREYGLTAEVVREALNLAGYYGEDLEKLCVNACVEWDV